MKSVLGLAMAVAALMRAGTLEVRIKDESGSVSIGASVQVKHRSTGAKSGCTTDSTGVCHVEVANGNYLVEISSEGLEGHAELDFRFPSRRGRHHCAPAEPANIHHRGQRLAKRGTPDRGQSVDRDRRVDHAGR